MKATIDKQKMHNIWTMADHECARNLQTIMKDDDSKPADYLRMAAAAFCGSRESRGSIREILSASAEIAGNGRLEYNYHGDGCGRMDVWISGRFLTWDRFVEIGCYLSDIWGLTGSNDETARDLLAHSYIVEYTRQK